MKGLAKYRKKPVVIEAVQWTGDNETELALFMNKAFRKNPKNCYELEIPTLVGLMTAKTGDYIIKGVKGEFYPCKPDAFAMTYESAGEANNNSLDEIIKICEKLLPFVDDGLSIHIEKIWRLARDEKERNETNTTSGM